MACLADDRLQRVWRQDLLSFKSAADHPEDLVNYDMYVPDAQEVESHLLNLPRRDKPSKEGEHVLVLVLPCRVVDSDVQLVWPEALLVSQLAQCQPIGCD